MTGHGTRSSYVTGCRCASCRSANTVYMQQWKKARGKLAPGDPRHGSLNAYSNFLCRCRPCKTANAGKTRAHRDRVRQAP